MADLKCAYLISGDDEAKIDDWRARMRRRAEEEGGPGALESFDARSSSGDEVAAALATLSFTSGTRYLLVDAIEAWKASDLDRLEAAVVDVPPDTVLLLIARGKAPARLAKAVGAAGGEVRDYGGPKPWEMTGWTVERARERGLVLDREAAKALVSAVGPRQGRLLREIEKLALMAHPGTQLSAVEVERLASGEASARAHDLADALVAGDRGATLAIAEELTARDERPARLIFPLSRRLREVHRVIALMDAGVPAGELAAATRLAPWVAKRTVAQARKADRGALERALCELADLELETRGGGALDEATAFSLALARAAG